MTHKHKFKNGAEKMVSQLRGYHYAHIDSDVGNHSLSQEILRENNFPPELVVNSDVEKFLDYVKFRKNLTPS